MNKEVESNVIVRFVHTRCHIELRVKGGMIKESMDSIWRMPEAPLGFES